MKTPFPHAAAVLVTATILGLFNPAASRADATASGQLSFTNVSITPGSGAFVMVTNWQGAAYAQATVSAQYASGISPAVNAAGDFSTAAGQANASAVNAQGSASGSVLGQIGSDNAAGQSWLVSWFMITGGTGVVQTLFAAQINGSLSVADSDAVGHRF